MTDQAKGQKVPKKQHSEKVEAVLDAAPSEEVVPPAPPEEPELTDAEREEAAAHVPKVPTAELKSPARYRVTAGGRAWWQGQCIKFTTGEEFTSETWDELNIARFRECGVTIEQIA